MIDKGEKIPFKERIEIRKRHTCEFFAEAKNRLKGKSILIACIAAGVLIGVIFVQNSKMIDSMNKILNQAEGKIHEIYDDSKVIAAYRQGSGDGLNAEDAFVLDKLTEVIDEIITEDMTDYEKEKAVYDWQRAWVTYSDEGLNPISAAADNYTPYGVLRSHNAICVGNATTFQLFMDALNIPCKIIHSTEQGEHAWNVVQLDGEWYHVDVTFDGGSGSKPSYAYFNVPDSVKDDGNWPWDHSEIPAANGTKYCYMLNNAEQCEDLYDVPAAIKKAIDEGAGFAAVILNDRTDFNRSVAEYISNSMYVENGSVYFSNAYSLVGKVVYKFDISGWNDGSGEIPPEVSEKLTGIINELNWGSDEGASYQTEEYEKDTYEKKYMK